jgi:hypothetical protein
MNLCKIISHKVVSHKITWREGVNGAGGLRFAQVSGRPTPHEKRKYTPVIPAHPGAGNHLAGGV